MKELCEGGLVIELTVPASPLLELTKPVATWRPGEGPPDCGYIARVLLNRWPPSPTAPLTVFQTTEKANNIYGGPPTVRPIHGSHVDHDLHVGEVYLRFCERQPALAQRWLGEDVRPKSGFRLKDPDAVLEFNGGARIHAVEFGGRYDAKRVLAFHEDCAKRERSYEIW